MTIPDPIPAEEAWRLDTIAEIYALAATVRDQRANPPTNAA